MKLPRVKPDDPITADLMNLLLAVAESCRLEVVQGGGLLMEENPQGGYTLGLAVGRFFWAKITGAISGGTYPWTEQFPDASGAWTAGTRTGVAYEENGNTSVAANTYVRMRRTIVDDYRFQAGTC
jgi:hypothetical protein